MPAEAVMAIPTLRVSVTVVIPLIDSAVPTMFPKVTSPARNPPAALRTTILSPTSVSYTHLTLPTTPYV